MWSISESFSILELLLLFFVLCIDLIGIISSQHTHIISHTSHRSEYHELFSLQWRLKRLIESQSELINHRCRCVWVTFTPIIKLNVVHHIHLIQKAFYSSIVPLSNFHSIKCHFINLRLSHHITYNNTKKL